MEKKTSEMTDQEKFDYATMKAVKFVKEQVKIRMGENPSYEDCEQGVYYFLGTLEAIYRVDCELLRQLHALHSP